MNQIELYYIYHLETLIVEQKGISTTRQSLIPEYPKNALLVEPLKPKIDHVVCVCEFINGRPTETKYIEDHRGQLIYNCNNCTLYEEVEGIGVIKEGFTLNKPLTPYDEWIDNQWITNQSNKYIADFNQIDETRRGLYSRVCDPLIAEANIKRLQGVNKPRLRWKHKR